MDYTALDLSPYYLYEARSNIKEWHRLRQPKLSMGGVDGSGAHFLQAAAEKIPQADASHDVVGSCCTHARTFQLCIFVHMDQLSARALVIQLCPVVPNALCMHGLRDEAVRRVCLPYHALMVCVRLLICVSHVVVGHVLCRIWCDQCCDWRLVSQVLSIYLFHELPPDVRRAAAKEMARVLKPGGILIITDSVQLGDRLPLDSSIGRFSDFNEPYYQTFIAEDLGKLFMDVGLECDEKLQASSSKVLSFRKPL